MQAPPYHHTELHDGVAHGRLRAEHLQNALHVAPAEGAPPLGGGAALAEHVPARRQRDIDFVGQADAARPVGSHRFRLLGGRLHAALHAQSTVRTRIVGLRHTTALYKIEVSYAENRWRFSTHFLELANHFSPKIAHACYSAPGGQSDEGSPGNARTCTSRHAGAWPGHRGCDHNEQFKEDLPSRSHDSMPFVPTQKKVQAHAEVNDKAGQTVLHTTGTLLYCTVHHAPVPQAAPRQQP